MTQIQLVTMEKDQRAKEMEALRQRQDAVKEWLNELMFTRLMGAANRGMGIFVADPDFQEE